MSDDSVQEAPSLSNLIKDMRDKTDEELQADIRAIRDERRKVAAGPPPKTKVAKEKSNEPKQKRPEKKTILDLMSDEEKANMLDDIKNLEI